jgi:pentatricopeptide repeat protein
VRKYGQNDTVLPKYLGVIGSCCYFQKRYKEAISFLQEALKVNDGLPAKKRITDNALFGVHSYFAMSLQEIEKYPQASEHFLRAIHIADNLPPGQIDQTWLKLCYQGLIYCLRRQGKYEDVLKFKERMAKLGLK